MTLARVTPDTATLPIRYTCKETAVLIRQALKAAFPDQRFSVTTHYGACYSATSIRWTDGPTQPEVERVTNRFTSKSFDGSDDSTHYHTQDVDGQRVQYSGWVNVTRETSQDLQARAYARICRERGLQPRADGPFWTDYRQLACDGNSSISDLVSRLLYTLRPNGCRVTLKDGRP